MPSSVDRLIPPYSGRRLVAQVARASLHAPSRARYRVNRENLSTWQSFRHTTMRCNICAHVGPPYFELPDLALRRHQRIGVLRETLRCTGCGAKMRDRTLAAGLLATLRERYAVTADTVAVLSSTLPAELRILDTDAYSAMSTRLAAAASYVRSVFVPGRANGEAIEGDRLLNVDLQQIPFPDNHFDIICTSEVMEHVRYVDVAHREIARCLRPGGAYLFTVPYDADLAVTRTLIDPDTDSPLEPLHIHGDPIRGGIKSYRIFGRDLVEDLRRVGLRAEFTLIRQPEIGVYDGDLFVATKLPATDETALAS
jgi:O-antigen biosynthesis protein